MINKHYLFSNHGAEEDDGDVSDWVYTKFFFDEIHCLEVRPKWTPEIMMPCHGG